MSEPVNPLKQLRLNKKWSLEQVGYATQLSKQLLIRSEQGCYNDIPPRLLTFALDMYDIEEFELKSLYTTFQVMTRVNNYGLLPVEISALKIRPEHNPFTAMRKIKKLSMAQVYKGFCLHPTILHKVENQTNLCLTVPSQFWAATYDSGYSIEWQQNVAKWYNEHRKWVTSKVTTRTIL